MALITNMGDDYTRTGKGGLTRWANGLSYFSWIGNIPILGSTVTAVLGYADTAIETVGWLMRGQIGSAATALTAGAVGSTVTALAGTTYWWTNLFSGVATGETLGTHARALTEGVIGTATRALGVEPEVLRSHTVGIGSIGAGAAPQQATPGYWASRASQERGQDANAAYAKYMSGEGGAHVNELQSAAGRA